MTGLPELYAALLVREFPAQSLLRLRSELHNRPCVVMQGDPPLQRVVSFNVKSRALGVVHGMTKVEVDTFPDVTVLRRSPDEEAATRAVLLECTGGFSPRIELCGEDREFLCVADIAGTDKLFGPSQMLARNLLNRVKALGLAACVAVSRNFHVAIAVAKGTAARQVRVISNGEEAAALASLPLPVLSLSEEQAETFSLWGIRTLGELALLPETALISRMGQGGRHIRQLARGEMPHLFQPTEPIFSLEERMELDSPVELLDALMFVVNVMLEQLILRATARVLALASVTIRLSLERGGDYSRTVRPALPTTDRQIWLKLLHLDMEAHPPQAAIIAVAIKAEPGSTSKVQFGLFSPQLPEPSRLDVTLARIRALVGEGNVGRPVLEDTHQENGFRVEPFTVPATRSSQITVNTSRPAMRMLRPAEVVFVSFQKARPDAFTFREHRYIVEHAYGPWLTSGEWWTSTLWGCEQWDLVSRGQNGNVLCCCLVRDRMRDDWKLIALYD